MTNPIRVGLIGLGRAGNGMHRSELRTRGDKFQFVAVCDCIEERTVGFVEEFGSRPYTKIEDILADPAIARRADLRGESRTAGEMIFSNVDLMFSDFVHFDDVLS